MIRRQVAERADVNLDDICACRETVETVRGLSLSLFTAINRGVNEKVALIPCIHPFHPSSNRNSGARANRLGHLMAGLRALEKITAR